MIRIPLMGQGPPNQSNIEQAEQPVYKTFYGQNSNRGTTVSDSIWPALSDASKISSIDKQKSA